MTLEIATLVAVVVSNAFVVWAIFRRAHDNRLSRATLGRHYADLAVAHAKSGGLTGQDLYRAACDGFIVADKALDGKRDFSDGEVALYVREALA